MASTKYVIKRGQSYDFGITYKKNGVAASLVGATIYFTIKNVEYDSNTSDTSATIKKDVTSHVDAAAGLSNVHLDPSDTLSPLVTPGDYFFDIWVKEADGSRYPIIESTLTIDGSPTNRNS